MRSRGPLRALPGSSALVLLRFVRRWSVGWLRLMRHSQQSSMRCTHGSGRGHSSCFVTRLALVSGAALRSESTHRAELSELAAPHDDLGVRVQQHRGLRHHPRAPRLHRTLSRPIPQTLRCRKQFGADTAQGCHPSALTPRPPIPLPSTLSCCTEYLAGSTAARETGWGEY